MYDDHEKTGESTKGNGVNISLNDLTVTRILFIVNVITLCVNLCHSFIVAAWWIVILCCECPQNGPGYFNADFRWLKMYIEKFDWQFIESEVIILYCYYQNIYLKVIGVSHDLYLVTQNYFGFDVPAENMDTLVCLWAPSLCLNINISEIY